MHLEAFDTSGKKSQLTDKKTDTTGTAQRRETVDGKEAQSMRDMESQGASGTEHWERVKKRLRSELGEDVYTSWFQRMSLEDFSESAVRLSVPTRFLKSWIQSHYRDRVLALWQSECADIKRIDIAVRSAMRVARPVQSQPVEMTKRSEILVEKTVKPTLQRSQDTGRDDSDGSPLDPKYTFETFAIGRANSLAHAAAKQVASARPGDPVAYNPLFIHANVGLGKSHLLHAIADAASRGQGRKVVYMTAERFMYRYVRALKEQSAISFKEGLRDIDLLLIDDMQFLQGKSTQQEFCHMLNALIDGARQVIVAADRAPVDLENLDERVRSRLAGGLVVEIGSPDEDLRRTILKAKAQAAANRYPGFNLPDAVIDHVAHVITSNGRDLDGAFNRLLAHNQLTGLPVKLDMVDDTLKDLIRAREPKRVKIEDIQRIVAKHFNVSKADLLSNRRTRTIVRPRQIAMYLAKQLTPRSLPEIGRRFGGRDHTTVLHAVRKVEELLSGDNVLAQEIELLKRMLEE